MVYRYGQKLQTSKRNLKKYIAGAAASLILVAGAAVPALAANDYCGASANGCTHADTSGCAGHGAFGAFGKDNSWAGGANGNDTAYANSTLCGNPQGAAGQL
jgi:hypothetical protein